MVNKGILVLFFILFYSIWPVANASKEDYLQPYNKQKVVLSKTSLFRKADSASRVRSKVSMGDRLKAIGVTSDGNWFLVKSTGKARGYVKAEKVADVGTKEANLAIKRLVEYKERKRIEVAEREAEKARLAIEKIKEQASIAQVDKDVPKSVPSEEVSHRAVGDKKSSLTELATSQSNTAPFLESTNTSEVPIDAGDTKGELVPGSNTIAADAKAVEKEIGLEESGVNISRSDETVEVIVDEVEVSAAKNKGAIEVEKHDEPGSEVKVDQALGSSNENIVSSGEKAGSTSDEESRSQVVSVNIEPASVEEENKSSDDFVYSGWEESRKFDRGDFGIDRLGDYLSLWFCEYFDVGFCERKYREIALHEGTLEAYQIYLNRFSDSGMSNQIRNLEEDEAYAKAVFIGDYNSLKNFDYYHQGGRYAGEVADALERLAELKMLEDSLRKSPTDLEIQNSIDRYYTGAVDYESIASMERVLRGSASEELKARISKKIEEKVSEITSFYDNQYLSVNRVGNGSHRKKSFYVPFDVLGLVVMTGEKQRRAMIGDDLSKLDWYDYGGIKNQYGRDVFDKSVADPAGGASFYATSFDLVDLSRGRYTLFYKTDKATAYGDFKFVQPLSNRWGIEVWYFGASRAVSDYLEPLAKYLSESERHGIYASYHERAKVSALKEEREKEIFDIAFNPRGFEYSDLETSRKIRNFISDYPDSKWVDYANVILLGLDAYQTKSDIALSTVEISDGEIDERELGWFGRMLEEEDFMQRYDDAEEVREDILSDSSSPISMVNGSIYYFSGYVENMSDSKTYNLNMRCEFQMKTTTQAGVWIFRNTKVKRSVKEAYFKILDLEPGERAPYVCQVKTNSGGAIAIGPIGASSGTTVEAWSVDLSEGRGGSLTPEEENMQESLLEEVGLDDFDFDDVEAARIFLVEKK